MGLDILGLVAAGSVAGGLVSLVVAGVAWRNRDVPASAPFGLLMFAISGWCFFAAAQMVATATAEAYVFDRLVRATSTHVPPLALVFILAYAGHDEWLTPRWLALLWAYPVLYTVVSATAPLHGLATGPAAVSFQTVAGVTAPVVPVGPAKTLHIALAYVVMALAYLVLFHLLVRTRSSHRGQTAIVVVGSLCPFLANAAFYGGASPHPGIDPTPMTFVLSGLVIGWGLFRYDFLSVTPLASDVLVDELPDPVLVLDEDDRVVDTNRAAIRAFDRDSVADDHVADVAPGLLDHLDGSAVYTLPDRRRTDGGTMRYYDPYASTLTDQHGMERGRLVVLREVTGQQRRQDRLEALQSATQRFITASTDEEIAELVVSFTEQVIDQDAAAVFLFDPSENVLRPTATTESVRDLIDEEDLIIDSESETIWSTYTEGARRVADVSSLDETASLDRLLLVPIDDYGVLAIGSDDRDAFTEEDEQFAAILSRTTQVALSQVEYERQLLGSHASVERRSEQIEFFNGVLRHTLRNALLVIQGRADHLREHVDDERAAHLDVVDRWCEDLAALSDLIRTINDTMTASETDRLGVVDLSHVLVTRARAVDEDHDDLTVDVDVEYDLSVTANELVERVVDDVLRNAVRHNDADEPRIDVTTRRAADRVQVYVADNGPGMSDELKETVFERDLATSQTANGFGLYFVSVIMNLYGGTVWFEDNDPRGTIAVLEFQDADES